MHRSLQILNKIQKKYYKASKHDCSKQIATISREISSVQPALRRRCLRRRPFQRRSCSRRRRRRGGGGEAFWDEASSSQPTCWKKLVGAVLLLDIYMKVCVCVYMRRSSMAATHQPAVLHCLLRSLAQERARRQWRGARCPGALPGQQHAWTCQCKKHIGLFRVAIAEGYHGSFSQNGLDERRFSWNKLAFFVF